MANVYQKQVSQYRRMKIETASPEMLILMLYDGAIKNITIAAQTMEQEPDQIETASNSLIKAQNIVTELMVSLNFEIGGDIAKNLFNIYEFINYTLAQANINKSTDNIDTVLKMLRDLRETWQEVIKINKEKFPNGIPAPATTAPAAQAPAPAAPAPAATPSAPGQQPPAASPTPATGATQPPANNTGAKPVNKFKQIYGRNMPRKI